MSPVLTFLVAEDNPDDYFLIEQAFKRYPGGLRWQHVHDGVEAREYIEGKNQYANRNLFPLPDVVLTDLKMPRLSGFDFLEWLRHEAPVDLRSTPVVILTSSHETSDVTRAYELGANSYLVKPSNFAVLVTALKELASSWSEKLHPTAV